MRAFRMTSSSLKIAVFDLLCFTAFAFAATTASAQCTPMAVNRVTAAVDDTALVPLSGNVHPLARPEFDQGKVDDSLPLNHLIMLLKRSPEQELALQTRIDQMHNRNSSLFQQWLNPNDVGSCFGVTDADIAAVSSWLQKHGFTIDSVPPGKMMVLFSGTAGQVAEAFHTEIHNLNVHNVKHIANMTAPQVPAALAPVIAGLHSLHDFFPKPLIQMVGVAKHDPATGKLYMVSGSLPALSKLPNRRNPNPLITYGNNPLCEPVDCEWLGPQDFYTIYNERPLLTGHSCRGAACDGTGQTIAVLEETDVCAGQSGTLPDNCAGANDLETFRSQFALPPPKVKYYFGIPRYCSDPGVQGPAGTGEESEAALDLQWASSVAPGANVDYLACATTKTTAGVDLAGIYAVSNLSNTISSFSLSYGICEMGLTDAQFGPAFQNNRFYNELWQQAVAQGQTVNIGAGDSGDDTCDRGDKAASSGWNVNGIASTPWDVALGGTDFTDNYASDFALAPTPYWNTNDVSPYGSALSYIPEITWNQACGSTLIASFINFQTIRPFAPFTPEQVCNGHTPFGSALTVVNGSGGGGISSIYGLPTWQSAYGVGRAFTSGAMRNLPDVSLFASGNFWGHALLFCESDILTGSGGGTPCNYANVGEGGIMAAGGTSFVAPQFNGVIALINQASLSRQGQANYRLYAMADFEYGIPGLPNFLTAVPSLLTCESNSVSISEFSGVFPACVFHNIYRTPAIGTATCGGFDNSNCIVDGNVMPCFTGSPDCFTATEGDAFGLLSISKSSFEPAWYQSPGYSDAAGLGSVNITNLVNNWTNRAWSASYASTTTISSISDASSTAGASNTTVTFTATVTSSGRGSLAPPMGTVSFYVSDSSSAFSCADVQHSGSKLLGTSELVPATGNASAVLSRVTAEQLGGLGTHQVMACFSGDAADDAPSAGSTAVTVDK
jgi:subtilase family serine protease